MSPLRSTWPHLRAAFIAFHVVAVLLAATPSTASALRRSAWDDPTVQAEFAAWAPRLGLDPATLADRLWGVAVGWNNARDRLLAPVAPYIEATGCVQSWQMFVAPHTFPTRFVIEEREDAGEWRTLFVERDPEHRWMADALGVERLRASIFRWGWSSYAGAYRQACKGLAARRFAEAPGVTDVRCSFEKRRTPSAAEVRAGRGDRPRIVYPYVVER